MLLQVSKIASQTEVVLRGLKWLGKGGIICAVFNVMFLNLMMSRRTDIWKEKLFGKRGWRLRLC